MANKMSTACFTQAHGHTFCLVWIREIRWYHGVCGDWNNNKHNCKLIFSCYRQELSEREREKWGNRSSLQQVTDRGPDLLSVSVPADKWILCEECARALRINVRRIISLVWQCTLCASASSCESVDPCGSPSFLTANRWLEDRVVQIRDRPLSEDHFN